MLRKEMMDGCDPQFSPWFTPGTSDRRTRIGRHLKSGSSEGYRSAPGVNQAVVIRMRFRERNETELPSIVRIADRFPRAKQRPRGADPTRISCTAI